MQLAFACSFAQNSTSVRAVLNDELKEIHIQQELIFQNPGTDTLQEVFLNDWINAFESKTTPLAERFAEDYIRRFHFAQDQERGKTTISHISTANTDSIYWERPQGSPDLIKVDLANPLLPGEQVTLQLEYTLKIPSSEFTRYGFGRDGNYRLRYWFLTPGVYKDGWQVYSHKNLNDQYNPLLDTEIFLQIPEYYAVISALPTIERRSTDSGKLVHLKGEDRVDFKVYLIQDFFFEDIETEDFHVITNLDDEGLNPALKTMLVRRIADFLEDRLGEYPHERMLVAKEDYAANPFYGLNQLPKFIRPFPDGFNYDLQQLKTITANYLENTLLLNPRTEKWIQDGIQTYLLIEYLNEFYPDMKIVGNLSDIFGVRWFHAANLDFNDQYSLLYMHMARKNLDQPVNTPQDSLIKFNRNIAGAYKAGVGLKYMDSFLENNSVSRSIEEFYQSHVLEDVSAADFERILKKNATKDIDWFFKDYIGTREKIDFKIRKVRRDEDSLEVTIVNKTSTNVPISLYGLKDGEIVYKTWVQDVGKAKTAIIPDRDIDRVALNYEGIIPEINQRDNYESVDSFLDKPLQVRLFKDVENPRYTQIFFMPQLQFNLYDGITVGPQLYNKTILDRNLDFQITPMFGFKSQTLIGSASVAHRVQFLDEDLFSIQYGASGSRFSYGYGLFYQKFTPFLRLNFRDRYFRNNEHQSLTVRNVNVMRDQAPGVQIDVPDYSVLNVNYRYSDKGMIDYMAGNVDFQLAQQFSKASVTLDYRKLFRNNSQINLRMFAGAFLYNDLTSTDYFSFALDRPTDYLFDYNYYGRSETQGLFSQQIIMAEGGFKSQLEPEFANQWLTTVNASTNIWKWIFVYGDAGVVKNKYENPKFVYDSGIRLSLIADYFEIFLPVYSNLGWEIAQENYDQRIRFIATLDLGTLTGLFSRQWY